MTPVSVNTSSSQSRIIAIKAEGWIQFVNLTKIVTIEAQGNYVLLQCESRSILLRESISSVAEGLFPYGFVRIHRAVIVNVSCVEQIAPRGTGEYDLRLKNGKQYTVSKGYKTNLNLLADLWLGRGCSLLTTDRDHHEPTESTNCSRTQGFAAGSQQHRLAIP